MRKRIYMLTTAMLAFCGIANAQSDFDYPTATQNIPAFPTAEGFGKFATGGRGGKVVTVTTLDDDATNPPIGSFRWALNQYPNEPITVVFNVSGWIILKDVIKIKRSTGLTIAGQTAPGEGITLYPRMFSINGCKNIVVRNMRFRTGSKSWDGKDIIKNAESVDQALCAENAEHVVFDHCTFGWSAEEIVNNQTSHFQTYSYCLLHEGLYDAGHHKGSARSFACQWGGSQSTFHHNMLAHNNSRSPRFQGARDTDYMVYDEYVNNVNYNWGGQGSCYGGENSSLSKRYKSHQINFMNNYYRFGPATKKRVTKDPLFIRATAGTYTSEWYLGGNYMDGYPEVTNDNKKGFGVDGDKTKAIAVGNIIVPDKFYPGYKFDIDAYTMVNKLESAEDAYQTVLDKVGCIVRDEIEQRIVDECKEGTAHYGGDWQGGGKYGIIDDPIDAEMVLNADGTVTCPVAKPSECRPDNWDTDGDGMPDAWETANGFDPNNAADGNYINAEGYTALEKYLCSLMGEEIKGEFKSTTDIRVMHAVKFNASIAGNALTVSSKADIAKIHLFDVTGACRLAETANKGTNTFNVANLPAGTYILWVSDKAGYRNAVKLQKN